MPTKWKAPKKWVNDREGPSRTTAKVILRDGEMVGKLIAAHPRDGAGRLYVALWDWTKEAEALNEYGAQHASAGGYGYDKIASCLSGMKFAGEPMIEDGLDQLRARGFSILSVV